MADSATDLARYAYWTVDLGSGVVTWSRGFYDLLGLEPGAAGGHLDIYAPEDVKTVLACLQMAVRDGDDFDFCVRVRPGRGEGFRRVRTKGCVEPDALGRAVRLYAVVCAAEEAGEAGAWRDETAPRRMRKLADEIGAIAGQLERHDSGHPDITACAHRLTVAVAALKTMGGEVPADKPAAPAVKRKPRLKAKAKAGAGRTYLRGMVEDMKLHWEDLAPGSRAR